jgi:hypothetical protein
MPRERTMKKLLFIILIIAAALLCYHYMKTKGSRTTQPAAPAPSTSDLVIDRATGKTAVDQLQRTRQTLDKVRTSPRLQLP